MLFLELISRDVYVLVLKREIKGLSSKYTVKA